MTPETLNKVQAFLDSRPSQDKAAAPDFGSALQEASSHAMRERVLKNLFHTLGATAAVGAGARGLMGLYNLGRRNLGPQPAPPGVAPIQLEVPGRPEEKRSEESSWLADFLRGDKATTPSGIPWALPAFTLGGAGAAYAGWKTMDHLLDSRRKSELEGEVGLAREHFRKALHSEATHGRGQTFKVGEALDEICQEVEKSAATWHDLAGMLTGGYGVLGGMAALGSGVAAYQATRKRQRAELLRKAQKHRQRKQWSDQPPPFYARTAATSGTDAFNFGNDPAGVAA